jgi:pyruvate,orthophosphate dikinase
MLILLRDLKQAVEFGAEGVGLCRTEHMFFNDGRIPAIREMIIASTEEERRVALAKLLAVPEGRLQGNVP